MIATYQTSHPGNLAIQREIFDIPVEAARKAIHHLDAGIGQYWHTVLVKPLRRAVRAKQGTVRVYTAGFGSSELSNVLALVGCEVVCDGVLS